MASYYGFAYHPDCLSYLQSVPKKIRRQIIKKVEKLAGDPHPPKSKMLQGMKDDEDKVYRERSGDYRILYVVRGEIVVVLDIDNRKDVYK